MNIRKSIISLVGITVIVVGAVIGMSLLEKYKNASQPTIPEKQITKVEVVEATLMDFSVVVRSHGKVEAALRSQVASQIGGQVIEVSPDLKVGKVLKKGAFIVRIDAADYETVLASARASLADAKLALAQEEARAEQNIKEWKRLGKGEASDLVARKPQLVSAEARIVSAEASVSKSLRDIERTRIVAPYEMKVEKKHVEVANYIMPGGRIVDGHSADDFEVRLPLTMDDYFLVKDKNATIHLVAQIGTRELKWTARYARDEGVVDQSTLSLPIMVTVEANPEQDDFEFPPVGLYVKAHLVGHVMKQKVVIDRDHLRLGDVVLLVDDEGKLRSRKVKVLFKDQMNAVIEGVAAGEQIITSPLETAIDGMAVEIKKAKDTKPLND